MNKVILGVITVFTFLPLPAQAYIGPGLAVPAVWALFGAPAAIAVLILILAYFPARYFYKKYKYQKKIAAEESDQNKDNP